jgi:mRNA interferase MazF
MYPTNVEIDETNSPLKGKATVLLNQVRTVDKSRIIKNYGSVSSKIMKEVNEAILASLGLE